MKAIPLLYSIILVSVLISACGSPRKPAVDRITQLEKEMSVSEGMTDTAKAELLANAYDDFARQFSKDSLSPVYLLKEGGMLMNFGDGLKAIKALDQLTLEYPASRQAPQGLFLQAFIYENLMGNLSKASELYRKFLLLYPKDELADDAKAALGNLGKTPEELVKEFEKKTADSTKSRN
jgi:tetratricopeptide (TPR) repeat protein